MYAQGEQAALVSKLQLQLTKGIGIRRLKMLVE